MLIHHLWTFPERLVGGELNHLFNIFGGSSIFIIGSFGQICVSIFFFLGGYDNQCPGQDVGFITYDPNNEYLQKIGGYEKILEIAKFAHNNNTGFDNYYDYNHIAERGGNPGLYSTYKAKVDGYFGTISNKGSVRYDNNMENFKTMVEYYYYIMK